MPSSSSRILEEAFQILQEATSLEEDPSRRIDAAVNYRKACSLFRKHLDECEGRESGSVGVVDDASQDRSEAKKKLLLEKIAHYERVANRLMRSSTSGDKSSLESSAAVMEIMEMANALLRTALDVDEKGDKKASVEEYMDAAALYMKGYGMIKDKKGGELEGILKRRLTGILDRVEQLKQENSTQTSTTSSSAFAPLSSDNSQNSFSPPRRTGDLSKEEIEVLKKSSMIASGLFMPWSDVEMISYSFRLGSSGGEGWKDPDGLLKLSASQEKKLYKWARPAEIMKMRYDYFIGKEPVIVHAVTPYTIRQKEVTDCSFIASLVICAAYERKFRRKLITSIIYPQKNGAPIYNPSGKYVVKLWLNGVARKVEVDDRFPVDRHGNLLCSQTSCKQSLELWVSLIEKAYMKLCGGYNFPGSNSGVDLFSLTGWIPERIYFPRDPAHVEDFETSPNRAWSRLMSANSFGDCLITLSCSEFLSNEDAEKVGLVTGHAYAVLQVCNTKHGVKLLQLKNPWARSGWKGKYSPFDTETWTENPSLKKELGYNPDLHKNSDDGIFWICWVDVLVYFENIFLSWNPALFSHRTSLHRSWPKSLGPKDDSYNIGENPQFVLTLSNDAIEKKASVWILLLRHVSKQEQEGSDVNQFMSLHINRNEKDKGVLHYPQDNRVLTGAYTNNSHVLLRYDVTSPEDRVLSLILSQYQKSEDLNYTLNCYCTNPFSLDPPTKPPRCHQDIISEWDAETAGGPPSSLLFANNPMWTLTIPPGGVSFQMKCRADRNIAVNLVLFEGSVKRKIDVMSMGNSTVIDSGNYRHGMAVSDVTRIPDAGDYTLVVSTYEGNQIGKFIISIFSSEKLAITPVTTT